MTDNARLYTSKRMAIVLAIKGVLETIDGTGAFRTSVAEVGDRLKFWDEVQNFPSAFITPGTEVRTYQGGGYKDRTLSVTIRCYVNVDNAMYALEAFLEDVETVIEQNGRLAYLDSLGNTQYTHDITVVSITTDEGVLEPLGVGEVQLEVKY